MTKKKQPTTDRAWKDQFFASISHWSKNQDSPYTDALTHSLDDLIRDGHYIEDEPNDWELFNTALHAILNQQALRVSRDLSAALRKCSSPIESAMLYALTIAGREFTESVFYRIEGVDYADRPCKLSNLCIEPQAQLGKHRVDFLLSYEAEVSDYSNPRKANGGEEIPGDKIVRAKLVVECDGHDFHDRTKEQARKDRERDRALQSFGFRVYRYTGSEIWSDVFKCAHEAVDSIITEAHRNQK